MNKREFSIQMLEEILEGLRTRYTRADAIQRIVIKRDAEGIKRCIQAIQNADATDKARGIQSPAIPETIAPCIHDNSTGDCAAPLCNSIPDHKPEFSDLESEYFGASGVAY